MKISIFVFRLLAGAALVTIVALHSGCVAVAAGATAGAGAVAYIRGDLETTLDSPYDAVVNAADRAIRQLEFIEISRQKDALSAIYVARTAQNKKVKITVTNPGRDLTRVEIRVGIFGDEALSMRVLEKIRSNL